MHYPNFVLVPRESSDFESEVHKILWPWREVDAFIDGIFDEDMAILILDNIESIHPIRDTKRRKRRRKGVVLNGDDRARVVDWSTRSISSVENLTQIGLGLPVKDSNTVVHIFWTLIGLGDWYELGGRSETMICTLNDHSVACEPGTHHIREIEDEWIDALRHLPDILRPDGTWCDSPYKRRGVGFRESDEADDEERRDYDIEARKCLRSYRGMHRVVVVDVHF